TRLGVAGGSYGGFMTNWILGHTGRFAAAETDRSIYDFFSWYGSSDAQGLTDYEFSGPPWDADSLYRALSPLSYAKLMRTPLLIVHSEDDRRTPITDAEQLFVMLRERGVPTEFVRYPRSYHGLSRTGPPWRSPPTPPAPPAPRAARGARLRARRRPQARRLAHAGALLPGAGRGEQSDALPGAGEDNARCAVRGARDLEPPEPEAPGPA